MPRDAEGITSVKNPLNHVTANQYDALNRLKQVTDPAPVSGVTKYAYAGLDQLTQVTDPRNLVTGYTVDGLGNLTRVMLELRTPHPRLQACLVRTMGLKMLTGTVYGHA